MLRRLGVVVRALGRVLGLVPVRIRRGLLGVLGWVLGKEGEEEGLRWLGGVWVKAGVGGWMRMRMRIYELRVMN
jgi:hypothetical protein